MYIYYIFKYTECVEADLDSDETVESPKAVSYFMWNFDRGPSSCQVAYLQVKPLARA